MTIMTNEKHLREESFTDKLSDGFSDFFSLSGEEKAYIVLLVALLIFVTTVSYSQTIYDGYSTIPSQGHGFPFENVKWVFTLRNETRIPHMSAQKVNVTVIERNAEISPIGLGLNIAFYSVLSFFVVKTATTIKDKIRYYRYGKEEAYW